MNLIIVNDNSIYNTYKEYFDKTEFIVSNSRLVKDSLNFAIYNFDYLSYNKPYFPYISEISIYIRNDLVSFLDLVYLLEYLYSSGFKSKANIIILSKRNISIEKDCLSKVTIDYSFYKDILEIKKNISLKESINVNNKMAILPNYKQMINLFASCYVDDYIFDSIVNHELAECDNDVKMCCLEMERKHIEYGFLKDLYYNYFREKKNEIK